MTKSYHKICDYCKKEIILSDESGNWLPYNLNNGPHDCRKKETKEPFTLEMVLKKLESIGISIDINKLRNCEIKNNANK